MTRNLDKVKEKVPNRPSDPSASCASSSRRDPLVPFTGGKRGGEVSRSSQPQGSVNAGLSQLMPSSVPPNLSSILATLNVDQEQMSFSFAEAEAIFLRSI
ncbi:hypothetical protein R1flu_015056 [Riccia fluitans]|uniref:Uncharacterized protein n=1 Tax=Riccia fluitans TaxID=41844 RepID=A0ABD1YIP8_9MARC